MKVSVKVVVSLAWLLILTVAAVLGGPPFAAPTPTGGSPHRQLKPPSTTISVPVVKPESSVER
jgi:hypothetical protein